MDLASNPMLFEHEQDRVIGGNGGRIHHNSGERRVLDDVVRVSTPLSQGLAGVIGGDIGGLRHDMPVVEHKVTLCVELMLRLVAHIDIDEDTLPLTRALCVYTGCGQQAPSKMVSEK